MKFVFMRKEILQLPFGSCNYCISAYFKKEAFYNHILLLKFPSLCDHSDT